MCFCYCSYSITILCLQVFPSMPDDDLVQDVKQVARTLIVNLKNYSLMNESHHWDFLLLYLKSKICVNTLQEFKIDYDNIIFQKLPSELFSKVKVQVQLLECMFLGVLFQWTLLLCSLNLAYFTYFSVLTQRYHPNFQLSLRSDIETNEISQPKKHLSNKVNLTALWWENCCYC